MFSKVASIDHLDDSNLLPWGRRNFSYDLKLNFPPGYQMYRVRLSAKERIQERVNQVARSSVFLSEHHQLGCRQHTLNMETIQDFQQCVQASTCSRKFTFVLNQIFKSAVRMSIICNIL